LHNGGWLRWTLGPIQLADRAEMNFSDTALDVVLAGIGTAAQFARDLDVRALRESLGNVAKVSRTKPIRLRVKAAGATTLKYSRWDRKKHRYLHYTPGS
jgi:hypothetical protein